VPEFDVLSLVPFAATGVVAILEAERLYLSRRAKALMGLAAAGFALGVPAGLASPTAGLFATKNSLCNIDAAEKVHLKECMLELVICVPSGRFPWGGR